jgi:putative lipase involved disintegration of autophagic bodies
VQGQVQVAVRKLLAKFGDEVGSITVTGHSLGGALAEMCAFDIVESGINHQGDRVYGPLLPVTAFTFEAPRSGLLP